MTTPKPSGRTLTEDERRATGRGRYVWRPRAEALEALDALAARWGCSRCEALERAVEKAAKRK